ncbi:MAG: threonine--tRNA ligase, partial [Bacteroidetes bacterium]|nr:threonine--tRNA ligase [Bacteroidota bacterium]
QLKEEFLGVLDLTRYVLDKLGFEKFTAQISLRDPENKTKYVGTEENWRKAEQAIIDAAAEVGLNTVTELGEAAFYGPKLDFMVKDALGRSWQLGTIQVDYNLPERFDLSYIGPDNMPHRPVMIHRAPFGSMERFTGVLIEHCAGKFPLWLTPEQFAILPVSDKFVEYAYQVKQEMEAEGLRGIVDDRNETIGRKIRDNELKRIPFLLVVGEKEQEAHSLSVRKQGEGDQGAMTISEFTQMVQAQL